MDSTISIQQMAMVTEVSAHTLRYYERIGLLERVDRDSSSGYRSYTSQDIERVRFIKKLRATGMPIREVTRYIELLREGDTSIAARLALLEQHRLRVAETQREIAENLLAIDKKIEYYKTSHILCGDETTKQIMPMPTNIEYAHK